MPDPPLRTPVAPTSPIRSHAVTDGKAMTLIMIRVEQRGGFPLQVD